MKQRQIIRAAFPFTIPVLTGYLFMGMAFGILLQSQGYHFLWAGLMSVLIYAGSMQFVAVNLLVAPFSILNTAFLTLMVNARHLFYGFSMLDPLRDFGKLKPYMVFSMTDETFTLLYSTPPPEGVPRKPFFFWIALLDHLYWITGSVIGGLLGSSFSFNSQGIEFVMTALFVSIFVEQIRVRENRIPALVGLLGALACLLLFGAERFMLPGMLVLVLALTLLRRPLERRQWDTATE